MTKIITEKEAKKMLENIKVKRNKDMLTFPEFMGALVGFITTILIWSLFIIGTLAFIKAGLMFLF